MGSHVWVVPFSYNQRSYVSWDGRTNSGRSRIEVLYSTLASFLFIFYLSQVPAD